MSHDCQSPRRVGRRAAPLNITELVPGSAEAAKCAALTDTRIGVTRQPKSCRSPTDAITHLEAAHG